MQFSGFLTLKESGGDGRVVPPVPFPNTEVKHSRAEPTEPATAWEHRLLPVVHSSVAQSVEHLTVNQGVTGSSPVRGATFHISIGNSWGIAKSVKARDFDSRTVGSSPAAPAIDSLAQQVEHLTFNQRVPGSSPGWITI